MSYNEDHLIFNMDDEDPMFDEDDAEGDSAKSEDWEDDDADDDDDEEM